MLKVGCSVKGATVPCMWFAPSIVGNCLQLGVAPSTMADSRTIFYCKSEKKLAILHFAPNTFFVFDPEAQVDGAMPFPPRSMSAVDGAIQENAPSTLHSEYIILIQFKFRAV